MGIKNYVWLELLGVILLGSFIDNRKNKRKVELRNDNSFVNGN